MQYQNFLSAKFLVGKFLTIKHALIKFVRLFHHQSFTLYGKYNSHAQSFRFHMVKLQCNKFLLYNLLESIDLILLKLSR